MISAERISALFADEQYALVQLLLGPHIAEDASAYAYYLESIYRSGDFTKTVLVHEATPFSETAAAVLTYVRALLKQTPRDSEKAISVGKSFLLTLIPLEAEFLDESWFVGKSEDLAAISSIALAVWRESEDEIKFLILAICLNPNNFEAIQNLCGSKSLTGSRKLEILQRVEARITDPVVFQYIALQNGSVDARVETDSILVNAVLRNSLSIGLESGVEMLNRLPPIVFKDITLASTISTILCAQKASTKLYTNALFFMKHYPGSSEAFFVAGTYYMSLGRNEVARKFFAKATSTLSGWIAAGVAFSNSGESAHAISAFRTATIKYPRSVLAWLYLGMEHVRTNELKLAQAYLVSALELCETSSTKGVILNEIAIICVKSGQFDIAIENLQLCGPESVFTANIGFAFLKQRSFEDAFKMFDRAVGMNKRNANALIGLAFCFHCKGSLVRAIDLYNQVLGRNDQPKKMENLLTNLIQLAVNEFALTVVKQNVPLNDEEMVF